MKICAKVLNNLILTKLNCKIMSLLKKNVVKTAKFNLKGKTTVVSEMFTVPNKDAIYVIHQITDEITHTTMEYKYGFSEYGKANDYFNSVLKGWII